MLNQKTFKIFRAEKQMDLPVISPGQFETDHKTLLRFAGIDGYVSVREIQMEGKKKMKVEDFLRGYRFEG
jgi:methionyl-tRNA formyltransferase